MDVKTQHTAAVGAVSPAKAAEVAALERCPIMGSYGAPSVMFVKGQGSRLWDSFGRQYLDFLSGLAVTSLGHAHPQVAQAIAEQAAKLSHVSNLFATEHNGDVALAIDRLLGGGGQVFFCNSGAEANEAAIKLARRWAGHGRFGVICAFRSFHGRTLATLRATGQPEKHEPFVPLPEGFRHVPYGDLEELERAADETTAAVLLEPILGEGGVLEPPAGFLQAVREFCDERQLLLIFDEVQTGFARTGNWFAHQYDGVQPDVVTMAKALGNGMPIGACWARAEVAAAFRPGDHATTFGGQPLATAAAKAVLAVMEEMDAPAVARQKGALLRDKLESFEAVSQVRGRGLLLASELSPEALCEGKITAAQVAARCLQAGQEGSGQDKAGQGRVGQNGTSEERLGLVVNAVTPTAIRWAPPLVVSEDEITQAVELFQTALKVEQELAAASPASPSGPASPGQSN